MRSKWNSVDEKQSLKDKLLSIMLLEASKPYREIDSSLIDECIDFLMELEGKERLSKEAIKQRVNNIPFVGRVTVLGSETKKKIKAKRLAFVAAVIAFILVIFSIFTLATENTFGDLLSEMGHSLMELLDDDLIDRDGVTMYKYDDVRKYRTVEELVESEKLDILYPTWLPKDVKISNVRYYREGMNENYNISCNNSSHSLAICLGEKISDEIKHDCSVKRINGYEVYYFVSEKFIQGNFCYKNNVYIVTTDTEENLFKIIKNLMEID